MLVINIILFLTSLSIGIWVFRQYTILHQKEKELLRAAQGFEDVAVDVQKILDRKKLSSKSDANPFTSPDLRDPGLLSTLIAVIVNKYGNVYLSVEDFTKMPKNDYVSVYIDTSTNGLILSMNHDLDSIAYDEDLVPFGLPDDNTFH